MHKVFVYGTLKRGHSNHLLLSTSNFVKESVTKGEMRSLGGFPAIHLNSNRTIHGEIYEVDDTVLERLDRLEGVPYFYQRNKVETPDGPVWVYTIDEAEIRDLPLIKDGIWRD